MNKACRKVRNFFYEYVDPNPRFGGRPTGRYVFKKQMVVNIILLVGMLIALGLAILKY